ncbi:P-type DNA transfer ATPase VirB11 [Halomonas casei]|uniref:P-type DNA transfer ATPase VirB11 n=1 Tax=Halomonas casei TaxID=2742613 RepID=UPI003CEB130C
MSVAKMATRSSEGVDNFMRPLDPLLGRPEVTELAINEPGTVWAKTYTGWEKHEVKELTENHLSYLVLAIASFNGVKPATRMSVILPGGERCEIIRPPGVVDGQLAMNIRKHTQLVKTLDQLEEEGAFNSVVEKSHANIEALDDFEKELLELKEKKQFKQFLETCALYKRNIVISGKTGSGKTTFARSLIEKVPSTERIITLEDVHELKLTQHENKLHLLYGEGQGRISPAEALKSCMRLSPDRIFLAELRHGEALDYIRAANSGHPGSITTTHANSAIDTFDRIASLAQMSSAGQAMPVEMIRREVFATIDVVLYFKNLRLVEVYYDPVYRKRLSGGEGGH